MAGEDNSDDGKRRIAAPPGALALAGWVAVAVIFLGACGVPVPAPPPPSSSPAALHISGVSLFAATEDRHWGLPKRLTEVSGLALTRDGRLLAHADEKAVVSEINLETGEVVKHFALGDDTAEPGDFEGIAVGERDMVYLVTSTGRLYRFAEGANEAHVAFETFDTGLAEVCEVEGLAYLPAQQSLILACKTNHVREMRKTVTLYAWSVRTHTLTARPWLAVPTARIAEAAGVDHFHPSSVEIDPATGRIILLAGREGAMAELSPAGAVLAARQLGPSHNQAEGAAILPDGALVIADEGAPGLRGGISRYPRAHD